MGCLARVPAWVAVAVGVGALGVSAAASAKCGPPRIEVFPPVTEPLPTNARIVIELYGFRFVDGKSPPPLLDLRAEGERVALSITDAFDGALNVQELVLKPATELRPRTRYELYLSDEDRPIPPDLRWQDRRPVAWTTADKPDRTAPRWASAPKAGAGVYELMGCGDEAFVPVSVAAQDDSGSVLFLAEVTPLGAPMPSGKARPTSYLVWARDGQIEIGHRMCTGPFALESGTRYSVKLGAVDGSGNRAAAPGQPLTIAGPSWPADQRAP
jgi:hypothetical protein